MDPTSTEIVTTLCTPHMKTKKAKSTRRRRARSDDEKSVTSIGSTSSIASAFKKGKDHLINKLKREGGSRSSRNRSHSSGSIVSKGKRRTKGADDDSLSTMGISAPSYDTIDEDSFLKSVGKFYDSNANLALCSPPPKSPPPKSPPPKSPPPKSPPPKSPQARTEEKIEHVRSNQIDSIQQAPSTSIVSSRTRPEPSYHKPSSRFIKEDEEISTESTSVLSDHSDDAIDRFLHYTSVPFPAGNSSDSSTNEITSLSTPRHRKSSCSGSSSRRKKQRSATAHRKPYRIFILLLHIPTRRFELVEVEYDPNIATIGHLIDYVPDNATEPALGFQRYRGLCRPNDGVELINMSSLATGSNRYGGYKIRRGEVILAIPYEYSGKEVTHVFKTKLLKHPKLKSLLSDSPLGKPKRKKVTRKSGSNGIVLFETVNEDEEMNTSSISREIMSQERPIRRRSMSSVASVESTIDEITQHCDSLITVVDTTNDIKTMRIYSKNNSENNESTMNWSYKAFSSFIVLLLQRHVFRPSAGGGGAPMGAQGLFICAAVFTMFFQYQKDTATKGSPGKKTLKKIMSGNGKT